MLWNIAKLNNEIDHKIEFKITVTCISGFPGTPFLRGIGLGETISLWELFVWWTLPPLLRGIPILLPLVVVVGDIVLLALSVSTPLPGGGGKSSTPSPSMSEWNPLWMLVCCWL